MARGLHDWKRFWCPRGGRFDLSDRGFLVDPEGDLAKYYPSDVVPFESIVTKQCLVLLGEPGIGKSTALERERGAVERAISDSGDVVKWVDLREFQTDQRLVDNVFGSPEIDEWRRGASTLHLFLDSLDEGLLHIRPIAAVLSSWLKDLPAERLCLRIACRTADWPAGLESALQNMWGEGHFGVFELVPLRRIDVEAAARSTGIDPGAFLRAIDALDAAAFGNRPVTLRFLMNLFKRGQSLPGCRTDLYLQGCRCLCEPSESRRAVKAFGRLTANQRVEVASRLAVVTQLSNRFAIWTGPDEGDIPDEDVALSALIGGTEGDGQAKTDVDAEALREALDTGLFSSRGRYRLGWAHQTYAEFLAARFLQQHEMAPPRVLTLILHPDGSGKVVPQLRETAGWLASMDSAVFRELAKTDPETLLRSDVATASHHDRTELVRQLLAAFESGDVLDNWDLRQHYASLTHPGLAEVVQPYLRDAAKATRARLAAVHLTDECKLLSLQEDLASIALDSRVPSPVRVSAAHAVANIGDAAVRAALKPLAHGTDEDPNDELKGYALQACWPGQLTAGELFAALTPRKDPSLFGSYWIFLSSVLLASLEARDFAAALRWALRQSPGDLDPLSELASEIMVRAMEHLDQPGVPDLVAQALRVWWQHSFGPAKPTEVLRSSPEKRHQIAGAMFPLVAQDRLGVLELVDTCGITSEDLAWLLSELDSVRPPEEQELLSSVIARVLDFNDVDIADQALRARHSNAFLKAAIGLLVDAVPLDSQAAQAMKSEYDRIQQYRARMATSGEPPPLPDVGSVEGILKQGGAEAFFKIWALHWRARQRGGVVGQPLAGWSGFAPALRAEILRAAETYLKEYRPADETAWWGQGTFPRYAMAAYDALSLLYSEAPGLFHSLSPDVWAAWGRIAVAYPSANSKTEMQVREGILRVAYLKSADTVLATLSDVIEAENDREGTTFVLQHLGGLWNEGIAELLRSKLRSGTLKPGPFGTLLMKLLENGDLAARVMAETMLRGEIPPVGPKRDDAIAAAQALILYTADANWPSVWPAFQSDAEFGTRVLQGLVNPVYSGNMGLAAKLSEDQIADLFIWLPCEKPEQNLGGTAIVTPEWEFDRWRESLLGHLSSRGTDRACKALRRIMAARPGIEVLKWHLKNAEELARRNTWIPIPPEQLIQLSSSPSKRWIRNGSDLVEVLLESLERLQTELQGENATARLLWNETAEGRGDAGRKARSVFRPKDESALSDLVKAHLDRDLRPLGAIVNREVEIHRFQGGVPGEEPDIKVDVAVPTTEANARDRVTVMVEVKCCWHEDLHHAMKTQLVERYMKNKCHQGLYVVGWFQCPQWDPEDSRRGKCPKIASEAAREQFKCQAAELSTGGNLVRAVVLNTALR